MELGIKLVCLGCRAIDVLTFEEPLLCWHVQMKRDRAPALAGIVPEDLYRPGS